MKKYKCLIDLLYKMKSATIAFSGGVDSSLVAKAAFEALGTDSKAVTVFTEFNTEEELQRAISKARHIGIKHEIIRHSLLGNQEITRNRVDRCYKCKREIMSLIAGNIADGTNADDNAMRPGLRVLEQKGISSPLRECGITKQEARQISRELGLPGYDEPANSCLATRIPFNVDISQANLTQVSEMERLLKKLGLLDVRARHRGNKVVIEANDFNIIEKNLAFIKTHAYELGFREVEYGHRQVA
jgi:uncharacterized protein